MIKTLRIASIVAAILAAIFFVFLVFFGARSDADMEQFLNSAGAVKKFNKVEANKEKTDHSQTSPLVQQAEAFARFLNPPPPPKPTPTVRPTLPRPLPKPESPVAAKFSLVGTSYYPSHPQLSLAFIDEPGKGLRWVRQGGEVGHLIIEQVKDGLIVVRDGPRTSEIAVPLKPQSQLVEGASPVSLVPSSKFPVTTLANSAAGITTSSPPEPQIGAEEIAQMKEFLKSIQASADSGEIDANALDNLFPELGSMRVSPDEAEKLRDLPKELVQDAQKDPNQDPNQDSPQDTLRRSRKVRRPVRPHKVNLPPRKK